MSTVSVLAGLVTRTWHATTAEGVKQITLTHHTMTGARELAVDSKEVPGSEGVNTALGAPSTITFEIDGVKGYVSIVSHKKQFVYTCTFGSETLAEGNEAVGMAAGDPTVRVEVQLGEFAADESGARVVWYRVRTLCQFPDKPERVIVVHRRFKEFCAVDEQIRSSYKGSTLLTSFPALPPRGIKLFQDHTKPEFVEQRRNALSQYLVALSRIPRMTSNLDFLLFLGISNDICEKSVIFQTGPLGMTLKGMRVGPQLFVEVTAFKNNDDGSKGQAELSNQINLADKLSKINGDNVLGESYEVVIAMIKAAHRPLVVHFLGAYPDPADHPADAASGSSGAGYVPAAASAGWATSAPIPQPYTPAPVVASPVFSAPAYAPVAPAPATVPPPPPPAPSAADLDML